MIKKVLRGMTSPWIRRKHQLAKREDLRELKRSEPELREKSRGDLTTQTVQMKNKAVKVHLLRLRASLLKALKVVKVRETVWVTLSLKCRNSRWVCGDLLIIPCC